MTFRQLLKRVVPADAQAPSRFDACVHALLCAICANVLVLFFVQGDYDIDLGPFHAHAYSLRNCLVGCFTLAIATVCRSPQMFTGGINGE